MADAQYFSELAREDGTEIVRLVNAGARTEVRIAPSLGANAYSMKVNGQEIFWSPFKNLTEFKAKPTLNGNPFLAPWANRIDGDAYTINGKRYQLNGELANFRRDANRNPIHGLVVYATEWTVASRLATADQAAVTLRLEFWRRPDWMAQFPFAHTIEMTYRLRGTTLEVDTALENHSSEPMPVAIGYHPYFQLTAAPRDEWRVHLAAREHMVLSPKLVPTGETKPVAFADPQPLAGIQLDDVFTGLTRNAEGLAEFSVAGGAQKLTVAYGPKYPVAVVYAPPGRGFICFEPMAAPTNAFNLAAEGKWKGLQNVAPGARWRESYWIRAEGF